MRAATTHMRLRASTVGRCHTTVFYEGATDMIRFLLLIASLSLPGVSQTAVAAEGKALYEATCIACHGPMAKGAIPGVPDLATGGRLAKSDTEVAANILNGFQSKGSPMAMPPKGGNPNLTAADAKALVKYLRVVTGVSASPAPAAEKTLAPADANATATVAAPATAIAPALASAVATGSTPAPDMAAFARGAKAWADGCARCHGMRDPKDLSDREWKVVMAHMRVRAGLDGRDARDITAFLQASN